LQVQKTNLLFIKNGILASYKTVTVKEGGEHPLQSVLIVSVGDKNTEYFSSLLTASSPYPIEQLATVQSCGEARRMLIERDFALVIINAPLRDESGESLARHIAEKGVSQVILVVANEHYNATSANCEDYGVLTVSKPINEVIFRASLKLARAMQNRLARMQMENNKLKQKIEDIRIVDSAKYILISYLSMSEQEAHRYIEKQAMDMRTTRRKIAEGILKTYGH